MNNGQKIKYMELCLAVAREEVEYAELYKEKEPDYNEDFDAWCVYMRSHRNPNKALIADNLRNVARTAFILAKEILVFSEGEVMTIKEYNTILYPKISRATVFVNGIEHAMQKTDNPDETWKQFACIGWSDECKETILEALECYKAILLQQVN